MKIKGGEILRLLAVVELLSCAMITSCGSTGDVQNGIAINAGESAAFPEEEVVELGDWTIRLEQKGHGVEWILIDLPNDPHDLRLLMQDGEIAQVQVLDGSVRDGAYVLFYPAGDLLPKKWTRT